jgi:hypothetical protein
MSLFRGENCLSFQPSLAYYGGYQYLSIVLGKIGNVWFLELDYEINLAVPINYSGNQ